MCANCRGTHFPQGDHEPAEKVRGQNSNPYIGAAFRTNARQPFPIFYALGLGILFGYVYARTGKLRYSIGLHMIINFLGSFVGSLILRSAQGMNLDALSKVNKFDTEAVSKIVGPHMGQLMAIGLYYIVIFGLVIAGLVLLIVRRKKVVLAEGPVTLPKGERGKVIFGNIGIICYIAVCVILIGVSLFIKI